MHLTHGSRQDNVDDAVERGLVARGEQHGKSKLTEDQARAILADTRNQQQIADDFGVARQTVSKIKNGETWTHLRDDTSTTEGGE